MRLQIAFGEAEYSLQLELNKDAAEYVITGAIEESGTASIMTLSTGVHSILINGRSFLLRLNTTATGELAVWCAGERFLLNAADPRDRVIGKNKANAAGPQEIRAQMPGKVVKILAEAGVAVEAGEGIIIVEAMKMQNEMKAPKGGIVRKVLVTPGSAVTAGEPLMIVE